MLPSVKKSELCVVFITVSFLHRWIGGSCDSTTHTLLLHALNSQVMLDWVYQPTVGYSEYTGVPKLHCLFNLKVTVSASVSVVLSLDFLSQCSQWTLI